MKLFKKKSKKTEEVKHTYKVEITPEYQQWYDLQRGRLNEILDVIKFLKSDSRRLEKFENKKLNYMLHLDCADKMFNEILNPQTILSVENIQEDIQKFDCFLNDGIRYFFAVTTIARWDGSYRPEEIQSEKFLINRALMLSNSLIESFRKPAYHLIDITEVLLK